MPLMLQHPPLPAKGVWVLCEHTSHVPCRYPPLPLLHQQLEEVGFHVNNMFILTSESFMKEEMLLDVQGPFDPLWRNTNRYYSSHLVNHGPGDG